MYAVTVPDAAAFAVSGTTWQLPQGFVIHARLSPCTQIRSAALIASAPIDHLSIFRSRAGGVVANYDGIAASLGPGDLVLLDYMRPIESVSGEVVVDSVILARDAAPARLRDGTLHGVVLRVDTPAGQLMGTHLDALMALIGSLPIIEAEVALLSLFDLAASLWPSADTLPAVAMLDRARAAIGERLGNPALTPELLAAELGISRAKLYRVFEAEGGVGAYIQGARLDRGLKLLIDDAAGPGIVGEIAGAVGFRHSAHFSRAFKARFGLSPSVVAARSAADMGGRAYTSWLETQGSVPGLDAVRAWLNTAVRSGGVGHAQTET